MCLLWPSVVKNDFNTQILSMRLPELWENFCFRKLRIIICLPAALPFSSVGTFRKTLRVFAPFTLPSRLGNVAKMQMSRSLLHLPRCDVCSFTTRHITHLQRSFNKKNGFLGVAIVLTRYKDMSYSLYSTISEIGCLS